MWHGFYPRNLHGNATISAKSGALLHSQSFPDFWFRVFGFKVMALKAWFRLAPAFGVHTTHCPGPFQPGGLYSYPSLYFRLLK